MNPIFGNDHHQFGLSFYEKSSNDDPNELNQKDKNYGPKSFNQDGLHYHKNSLSYDDAIKINNINLLSFSVRSSIICFHHLPSVSPNDIPKTQINLLFCINF